jgi:hypothetical protein
MVELESVSLPRTLVNQLLHSAQLHISQVQWGIISAQAGNPAHCYALNDGLMPEVRTYRALCATLNQGREQPWALYRLTSRDLAAPDTTELERMLIPRLLDISLGIQGVLQLRGWRVESGKLLELEVNIHEH